MPHDVLVIDDDADERSTISEMLHSFGLTVTTAPDGAAGLSVLRSGARPQVVVLDLLMPEKDGWTVLWEMRRDPGFAKVPVIVITATSGQNFLLNEKGVVDYLVKPFDPRELVVAVKRALRGAK